jgi:hypothetical protein
MHQYLQYYHSCVSYYIHSPTAVLLPSYCRGRRGSSSSSFPARNRMLPTMFARELSPASVHDGSPSRQECGCGIGRSIVSPLWTWPESIMAASTGR